MINETHTLHPTIQDNEKCMARLKPIKTGNPARAVTSECNTPLEHLPIFVEKVLYEMASELQSRIKNTNHILVIIDDLNNSN